MEQQNHSNKGGSVQITSGLYVEPMAEHGLRPSKRKERKCLMNSAVIVGCAAVLVGFTTWYLRRVKDKLFDDIDIKFRRGDLGGWGDD